MKDEDGNPLKLVFAPGCFDSFTGTQEELDEMIAEITAMFEDGTLLEKATIVDLDDTDFDIESLLNETPDINNPDRRLN